MQIFLEIIYFIHMLQLNNAINYRKINDYSLYFDDL